MNETDQTALRAVTTHLTRSMAENAESLLEARSMQVTAANGFTQPRPPSSFDPSDKYIPLSRKQRQPNGSYVAVEQRYIEVKYRLAWFRAEHPDWLLAAELVPALCDPTMGRYVARAEIAMPVVDAQGSVRYQTISVDYGTEDTADWKDAPEKALTKSKGRCLASLGYGTLEGLEFEYESESTKDFPGVDAPVNSPRKTSSTAVKKAPASHLLDEAIKLGATPAPPAKVPTPIRQHPAVSEQEQKLDKVQAELRPMLRPDSVSGLRWQKLIRGYDLPSADPDGPDGDPSFDLPRYFADWRKADAAMVLFVEVTGFDIPPAERNAAGIVKAIVRYMQRKDAEVLETRMPNSPHATETVAEELAPPQRLPDATFAFSV